MELSVLYVPEVAPGRDWAAGGAQGCRCPPTAAQKTGAPWGSTGPSQRQKRAATYEKQHASKPKNSMRWNARKHGLGVPHSANSVST